MATNGNRDVTLAVGIKTSGEEALRSLAGEVQNLAKRGKDAAPAYQAFADELIRLSQQAAQLEAFRALSADVERLGDEQTQATAATTKLSEALRVAREETLRLSQIENAAQAELKASRDSLAGKRYEQAQLNIETSRAAKGESEYINAAKKLKQEILDGQVAVRGRKDALREAAEATEGAASAEKKLSAEYDRSVKAADRINTALNAQRQAMTETASAAEQLGLSVRDAAAAEERLNTAQRQIMDGVAELRIKAAREQAEADRLAIIEMQAKAELAERGRVALLAETRAIEEAAEASRRYAAFQAEVAQEVARREAEERKAAEATRQLIAATTKADEEARALAANADRIRFYAQAFDQLAEREKEAAAEAERLRQASLLATEALRDAFGTTGVRSLAAVQAEVQKVGQSLNLLEANYRAGAISAADLARATSSAQVRLAQLRQEANTVPALPNVFERMNSSINDLIGRFGSLTAAIATVGLVAKPVIDANIQLEQLRRTLTAVTGSSKAAGEQIDFLRRVASENGLQVGKLSNEYVTFVTSLVKSGISMKDTQSLFSGVAAASDAMGLSTERASLVLLALGQVASKGKVLLEEVQSQIGESLPGALKIMADSLGITTAEFTKLAASGNLLADEFLPKFGQGLLKTFGGAQQPVDGLAQAFAKLSNKFTELQQKLADTAIYKGLVVTLQSLTANFDTAVAGVTSLTKAFLAFKAIDIAREFFDVKAAAEAAAAAKTADAAATARLAVAEKEVAVVRDQSTAATVRETAAVEANTVAKVANARAGVAASATGNAIAAGIGRAGQAIQGTVGAIGSLGAALGGLPGIALTATIAFSDQLGKFVADTAARITGLKKVLDQQEKDAQARAAAEKARAAARQQQIEDERVSITRLLVDTNKQIKQAEESVKVAENVAQARKTEGEATQELARITGDEVRVRYAAISATLANEDAQRKVSAAYEKQIEAVQRQRQALIDNKGSVEALSAAEKEQVEKLELTIKELESKKLKVDEMVEKERSLAIAAQLSAEKLTDQSGALEKNQQALQLARETLAQMIELERQGVVSSESVRAAREAEAVALARVNNSIEQRLQKLGQEQRLRAANIEITKAKIEQNLAEERTLQALAEGNNDLIAAEQSKIRQKEIGIQKTREEIKETLDKARTDREAAQEELKNRADLTDAQKRELEIKIASATASENEALARQKNVSAIEAEVRALRNRVAASTTNQTAGVIDGSGMGSFSAGVKSTSGINIPGGGAYDASYVFDLWARFQRGEVTANELPAIKNALNVAENNARLGGPGSVSFEGKADDQKWIQRLRQIVESLDSPMMSNSGQRLGFSKPNSAGTSSTPTVSPASAPAPSVATRSSASSAATPVTINIDGRSLGTVNVASGADAATLQSVLQQLVSAQGRSA